jgi:WD repeat-containing protein 19
VGRVEDVRLNDRFAAVLAGDVTAGRGQVTLHEIEAGSNGQRRRRTFPEADGASGGGGGMGMTGGGALGATAVALTESFLIYGTRSGNVEFFLLDEWTGLTGITMRHSTGIKKLFPNPSGTRVVVLDDQNEAFMGNAVTCELTPFPQFPQFKVEHIMWDMAPEWGGVVMVYDSNKHMHTYVYAPTTNKGAVVTKLGHVDIKPNGEIEITPEAIPFKIGTPIVSHFGEVTSQNSGGTLDVALAPHFVDEKAHRGERDGNSPAAQRFKFTQALTLLQLRQAWDVALTLGGRAFWLALSYKAMEVMDVAMAIRVYRQLGDAGMVMGLERLLGIEDKKLLAGHIALLYDDYTKAQELFLSSSRPVTALEMRRDLLHWDKALKLAQTLAPSQAPEISVEYARQLEFKGEYQAALKMFESALQAMQHMNEQRPGGPRGGGGHGEWAQSTVSGVQRGGPGGGSGSAASVASREEGAAAVSAEYAAMQTVSMAGIARCTLRLGDLRRGLSYVRESGDVQLCRDCARILEGMKHVANEAAELYELGEQYDRAAAIYIKSLKSLEKAKRIMHKVSQTKLLSEYAQRCEKEKDYESAAEAYERARDMDSVVRLYLEELGRPEKAFDIVRKTASSTGAQLVAHYCKGEGNYRGAIEFLLMAKCSEDAFVLAKAHECMDVYTKVLGDGIAPDEAASVASYYEGQHLLGQAGHFYSLCGQYARALKLFLQCGEKEVDRAIEVVGKARNDMLTHTLIDFLMGETDGVPKEPFHIYRLYLALGNYTQAAKTAVIISRQEQDLGNYKQAHNILFETIKQLEEHKVRVPQSLRRPFTLLHSYMLVKKLVKRGDHAGAARMLLRVAVSISKFPSHKVPILTSTVIECTKAGLKASALEYAMQLMRPEYRQHVDPKFKRKIEGLVRRPKDPNPEEEFSPLSPCPISSQLIPITSLECPTTKDAIPM